MTRKTRWTAAALVLAAAGGAAAGRFLWRKHAAEAFGSRYAPMSDHYKQVLFLTGQGQGEPAAREHAAFALALADFRRANAADWLSGDPRLGPDLDRVEAISRRAGLLVQGGDPAAAHLALEEIRPILAEVLRRKGFSPLKVALTDFHDRMEQVIDAGKGRAAPATLSALPAAEEKLRAVEQVLDDARVRAIREALDTVRVLAEQGKADELPGAVGALRTAFVKLYLAEG